MAWSRYGAIGIESVYGTPVSYTKYFPLITGSINESNNVIQADTVESAWAIKQRLGPSVNSFSIDTLIEPESIGLLLKTILPTVASGSETGTTKSHVFTPIAGTYPIFTLGIGSDVTAGEQKLASAMTTKMTFKAAAPDLLSMSMSGFGQKSLLASLASPSFATPEPLAYYETSVEIATVANADVEAIEITMEKDRFAGSHVLGTRFNPRNSSTGRFKVYGKVDLGFETLTAYKQFYDGSTGVTPPAQTYTQHAIELLTTGIITDTPDTYLFNVVVPQVMFDSNKADVSKADRTIQNVTFKGVYNVTATNIISVLYQNQVASYA